MDLYLIRKDFVKRRGKRGRGKTDTESASKLSSEAQCEISDSTL